jgi:hypothetical protein
MITGDECRPKRRGALVPGNCEAHEALNCTIRLLSSARKIGPAVRAARPAASETAAPPDNTARLER